MMGQPAAPVFAPLTFRRTLAGMWSCYPLPDYALTIRSKAEGHVFRGKTYPDLPAAIAAANEWWARELRRHVVIPDERRAA